MYSCLLFYLFIFVFIYLYLLIYLSIFIYLFLFIYFLCLFVFLCFVHWPWGCYVIPCSLFYLFIFIYFVVIDTNKQKDTALCIYIVPSVIVDRPIFNFNCECVWRW